MLFGNLENISVPGTEGVPTQFALAGSIYVPLTIELRSNCVCCGEAVMSFMVCAQL